MAIANRPRRDAGLGFLLALALFVGCVPYTPPSTHTPPPTYTHTLSAADYCNRGNAWTGKGELDKAIADYDKAIELNPNDAVFYGNRGNAWVGKGEFDNAIADCNKAIELDPKYVGAYCNRGNAWAKKSNFDKAIADYDKAIELYPKYASFYSNRGLTWAKKGEFDKAIADCNKAIELDPDDALAYKTRGAAWAKKGDFDKAIADCNKAIELDPNDALDYNNRGYAWVGKGELDKAIADCNKAIELDPKYATAYCNRGNAWSGKGELDKAIADYTKAIELDPKAGKFYNSRGWAFIQAGDYRKAIVDLGKAIELDPSSGHYDSRAWAYFHLGEYEKAEADRATAQRLTPKYNWPKVLSFRLKCVKGNVAEAVKEVEAALKLVPDDDIVRPLLEYYMGKVTLDDLKAKVLWGDYEVAVRGYGPDEIKAAVGAGGKTADSEAGTISCDLRVVNVADGSVEASATGEAKGTELQSLAKALSKRFKEKMLVKGEIIAVVSLRNRSDSKLGRIVADELADKIAGAMFDSGWFDVKERIDLRAILSEKDLETAGIVKNPKVKDKLSGIKYIVIGGVTVTEAKTDTK